MWHYDCSPLCNFKYHCWLVEVLKKLLGLGLVFFIKWMINWFQGQVQSFRPLVPWIKDPRLYEAHWLWVQGGADLKCLFGMIPRSSSSFKPLVQSFTYKSYIKSSRHKYILLPTSHATIAKLSNMKCKEQWKQALLKTMFPKKICEDYKTW